MASALRRRRALPSDTPSESPTPGDESPEPERAEGPDGAVEDEKVKVAYLHKKTRKRRTTAIFLLGSLFGIVVAGFFANSNDLINLPDIGELSMDSLLDVLPAGLVKDMRDLVVRCGPPLSKRELVCE
jgi:phospholipid:diacylglycerol acyltransferase